MTLTSLYHELKHLVDNLEFNGLNDANNIIYSYRWYEIKARYISELFLCVYKGINSSQPNYNRLLILSMWIDGLRERIDGLNESIENEGYCNHEIIDLELTSGFCRSSQLICEYTLKNQSYYRSLRCINNLNQTLDQILKLTSKR